MFPVQFDRRILESLPLPGEAGMRRVSQILMAIVNRRILPYFKKRRGTDVILLARLAEQLTIRRFEDEQNRVRNVSLVIPDGQGWTLQIHERIVDYLAFVFPSDPDARLGDGTSEERKMLAFAEVLLRHEVERMLYAERAEREIIRADLDFAMERRTSDPTFYQAFRQALSDEMNGIRGERWSRLLDQAERKRPVEAIVTGILAGLVRALADMPATLLRSVFPMLDPELQSKVLGECFRRSEDASDSLTHRAAHLQAVLGLFGVLLAKNEQEARNTFNTFKERWGLVGLFRELDLTEASVEDEEAEQLFELFSSKLGELEEKRGLARSAHRPSVSPEPEEQPVEQKSLQDRIEEARNDPSVPVRVMEVIDKNKLNAVGHSGAKYSELIETLLAIPWGKNHRIQVSPGEFEEGLDETHYGLRRPKEMVCDFFTNLIWRYRNYREEQEQPWQRTGSAFLFVGPPGVGKTSFAISIARNLGIPYHKSSLGGMRDEADLRGHGFTYEGSKPGAIVQGLIKMGAMNGMFILDEADKTEKFAVATLLEILDPEQNHLFHDKFTQTTVDIDLSNCHFVLTANTLDTVPAPVVDRCEVVLLDRYSVEEKVAIARQYLIGRVRGKHHIDEAEIFFDPEQAPELLRYLIKSYTYEAGVRQLERVLRTLFLRVQRKEILTGRAERVRITRREIKRFLDEPRRPRQINEEDCVGEMLALGVDVEKGVGSIIPIQATSIGVTAREADGWAGPLSVVHATGNIEKVMDESRKVATTGILSSADELGIDTELMRSPIHLHFMGGSTRKDGPSAGGPIALALASLLSGRKIRRDVTMTGEIDTQGRITGVGGVDVKLETAFTAGCKTMVIPEDNLKGEGGLGRLPEALREELQILTYRQWSSSHAPFDYARHVLQVVAVGHVIQAAEVAFIRDQELEAVESRFAAHAEEVARVLEAAQDRSSGLLPVVQIKSPEEIGWPDPDSWFWQRVERCALALAPDVKRAVQEAHPDLQARVRLVELREGTGALYPILEELVSSPSAAPSIPVRVAVVAPFFFLKIDGILDEKPAGSGVLDDSAFFANNYTVQDVKIKNCKALLNRACCYLSLLDRPMLESCPFLGRRDGVYVVDLSVIPEKYRLDVKRAEEILNRCLSRWLKVVEGAA